jgi:hypothetical protein
MLQAAGQSGSAEAAGFGRAGRIAARWTARGALEGLDCCSGFERVVHRTTFRGFEESLTLRGRQAAFEREGPSEEVGRSFAVPPSVSDLDDYAIERRAAAFGRPADRHRCAGCERRGQDFKRRRARTEATRFERLVR